MGLGYLDGDLVAEAFETAVGAPARGLAVPLIEVVPPQVLVRRPVAEYMIGRSPRLRVEAALTMPWWNGPVEGHVHRVKLIKRQGYGRAKLALLRRRVLAS